MRGLYAHVPFCFHKCHYCDFYSIVDREDRQPAYLERIASELAAASEFCATPLETVFVGGGTPTFLRPDLLARLLELIRTRTPLAEDAEWTVEANPETVTDAIARTLVAGGVNRTSLGAQSFDPRHLATLERWHDPASVPRAVSRLRAAGVRRVSLDLIFGIPGATLDDWKLDLERALALEPDHLSCYGLTYEPNTALRRRLELGRIEPCDEELEAEMYEWTIDRLARAGYEQYEISNFARPGERCRHNLLYWTNADWWAVGPSASGHLGGVRFRNVPRLSEWLAGSGLSPVVDVEHVDEETRSGERLMVGLRLRDGMDRRELEECLAGDAGPRRRAAIERGVANALLKRVDGRLRLTRAGLLLADAVLAELL